MVRVSSRRIPRSAWALVVFGVLSVGPWAIGQPRPPSPVCIPGTPLCATVQGGGTVQAGGSGTVQVTPGGASGSGQAGASGSGQAGAGGSGQAGGAGGASGSGQAGGGGGGGASGSGQAEGSGGSGGSASGSGSGSGAENYGGASGGGGGSRYRYTGRFGVGVSLCPIFRVGIWSGYKGGGCAGVSFRFESFAFEMETQLLYGGTTNAFDWTFPMSFLIFLGDGRSIFDGPHLRFGGSPVGATFARTRDGGNFVRFGLFAGAGYELLLSSFVTWRVIDARISFDMATRDSMDRLGHGVDLGLQLGTGIVF